MSRTLVRVIVTHRDLLEWETAAAAEGRLGNELGAFARFMSTSPVTAGIGLILVSGLNPAALPAALPVLALWLAGPAIAYWISQPGLRAERELSVADRDCGILLLDGSWRSSDKMVTHFQAVAPRSLHGWKTAYPRVSKLGTDPDNGLASIEALYIAYHLLGRPSPPGRLPLQKQKAGTMPGQRSKLRSRRA